MQSRHHNESKPSPNFPCDIKEIFDEYLNSTKLNLIKTSFAARFASMGKNEITVLEMACGYGFGFLPLLEYFQEHNIKINYTGMDINQIQMKWARYIFAAYPHARFIQADCSNTRSLQTYLVKGSIDLVFIQHPEVLGKDQTVDAMRKMFTCSMPWFLAQTGYIYLSLYTSVELDTVYDYKINTVPLLSANHHEAIFLDNPPEKPDTEYTCAARTTIPLVPNRYVYCSKIPWGKTTAGKQPVFLPELLEEIQSEPESKNESIVTEKSFIEKNTVSPGKVSKCGMFKVVTLVATAAVAICTASYLSVAL